MALPLYKYQPLDPGHIRIITLTTDPNNGDCTGSIQHVSRKSSPAFSTRFAALSYTWGDTTDTFPFICDGQNLPVRKNLKAALRRICRLKLLSTPLWVDAMCINQEDEEEKIVQIQLMTDIYKKAEGVLIWLGELSPQTITTITQIPKITSKLKTCKQPSEALRLLSPTFIEGTRELLTCPWWPRLWVLQEATLARSSLLFCGPQTLPWTVLSAFCKQIQRLHLVPSFRGTDKRQQFCDGFTEVLNIEAVRHTRSIALTPNLLRTNRQRICADLRDRVYAVMGLMPSYVRETFTWEPGESVEELYPPFAALMLQSDAFGIVLSLNETTVRDPRLPTWCPDLHQRAASDVLADWEGYHAGYDVHSSSEFEYDQEEPRRLVTKGFMVDVVEDVVEDGFVKVADEGGKTVLADIQPTFEWMAACIDFVSSEEIKDQLWRVFIGNMIGSGKSKIDWLAGFGSIHDRLAKRRWKTEACELRAAFDELIKLLPQSESTRVTPPGSIPAMGLSPSILLYLEKMRKVCFGRKFFVTQKGRAGLGPLLVKPGQAVGILKGVNVPFIFAETDDQHDTVQLVGEAYVHGLMCGEGLMKGRNFDRITMI